MTPPSLSSSSVSAGLGGEPLAMSPLWVQHSGLPAWLNDAINRSAWLVFKMVMELDCARNARPGTVEVPPADLADLCGLEAKSVMRTLEGLRKKKKIALFLPEHAEESALVEIKTPLETPRSVEEVRESFPFNRVDAKVLFRYSGSPAGEATGASAGQKKDFQRVLDLYFNIIGFKMNSFIMDELRLICQRFQPREVEKTFSRAEKNGIRSLAWVVRELYRTHRRDIKKATRPHG